jgi:hypothetical protein
VNVLDFREVGHSGRFVRSIPIDDKPRKSSEDWSRENGVSGKIALGGVAARSCRKADLNEAALGAADACAWG